jgi:hypothetical protein
MARLSDSKVMKNIVDKVMISLPWQLDPEATRRHLVDRIAACIREESTSEEMLTRVGLAEISDLYKKRP